MLMTRRKYDVERHKIKDTDKRKDSRSKSTKKKNVGEFIMCKYFILINQKRNDVANLSYH